MKHVFTLAALALGLAATSAAAEDPTWRNAIGPMIQEKCAECHGPATPTYQEWRLLPDEQRAKVGPRMDNYTYFMAYVIWPATGAQQRRLDDGTNRSNGEPGNMYRYLGANDEERAANLALLKAWMGEDAWHLNRWGERDGTPGVTKEQLEAIKAPY